MSFFSTVKSRYRIYFITNFPSTHRSFRRIKKKVEQEKRKRETTERACQGRYERAAHFSPG